MLVGVDSRFEMLGTIPRRRGEHHDVNIGSNQLLKRIETDEALFRPHFDAVFPLVVAGLVCVAAQRPLQLVLEEVGNRNQFHVLRSGHQVDYSLRTALTRAHQAGPEALLSSSADQLGLHNHKGGCRRCSGNRLKKISSGIAWHVCLASGEICAQYIRIAAYFAGRTQPGHSGNPSYPAPRINQYRQLVTSAPGGAVFLIRSMICGTYIWL